MNPQLPDDSLRAVLDGIFSDPHYRWAEPPDPFRWLRDAWVWLQDRLLALRTESPGLFRVFVAALAVLLALILLHAAYVFALTVRGATRRERAGAAPAGEPRRDGRWYLARADEAARAGRFLEALRLGFTALALHLDGLALVRYGAGKTPADYAREARVTGEDRERLRRLVQALYRHAYGGVPCGAEDYARWRADALGEWHATAP